VASIADIVRHGRSTGEFSDGLDADELGIQIGAVVDGLAIQVLMEPRRRDARRHAAREP
jgi:hypothetical protein